MSDSGFTLVELMVVCVLLALLCSVCGAVGYQSWRAQAASRDYTADLHHCRSALRAIETDLRLAHAVEPLTDGYRILLEDGRAEYRFAKGELHRSAAGRTRVVGRRLASFELRSRERLVDVRLASQRRAKHAPPAVVGTSILLRARRKK